MKNKHLIYSMTLLLTSPLVAEYEADSCCDYTCSLDCEGYRAPYYNLECDWGMNISVDFLYWYSKETKMNYGFLKHGATIGEFTSSTTSPPTPVQEYFVGDYQNIHSTWDPGVRLGLGVNSCCSDFDLQFLWTYYKSCRSVTSSFDVPVKNFGSEPLSKTFLDPGWTFDPIQAGSIFLDTRESFNQTSWEFEVNRFDIEIGYRHWLSSCFTVRPHFGLTGFWTETKFPVYWSVLESFNNEPAIYESSARFNSSNCKWGVGFMGGLESNYFVGCGFSIYGNVAFALDWGKNTFRRKRDVIVEDLELGPQFVLSVDDVINYKESEMQAIGQIALGISWEDFYCCRRYHVLVHLGWEHQAWYGLNNWHQSYNNFSFVYPRVTDLGMGGLVLKARFDF